MSARNTLEERAQIDGWMDSYQVSLFVRAELNRLAGKIRKSKANLAKNAAAFKASKDARDYVLSERCEGGVDSLNDVLYLIREARR